MRMKTALGLLVMTVVATACGGSSMNHAGSSMDHGGGTSSPTAGKVVEVVMKDNSFSPDHLSVKKGETVTFRFTNSGAQLHEAVIGNEDAQAQAAVRLQGTHAQLLSQGEGPAVVVFGVLGLRSVHGTLLTIRRPFPPLRDVSLA